jgi:hypothetical protein
MTEPVLPYYSYTQPLNVSITSVQNEGELGVSPTWHEYNHATFHVAQFADQVTEQVAEGINPSEEIRVKK